MNKLHIFLTLLCYYHPKSKLREGNVFTQVCLPTVGQHWEGGGSVFERRGSTFGGRGLHSEGGGFGRPPPPQPGYTLDTVNKRALRILLECFIVLTYAKTLTTTTLPFITQLYSFLQSFSETLKKKCNLFCNI